MPLNSQFATGVQALLMLAAEPEKLHRSQDVAQRLGTNPVVVRRLFSQLHGAGLVQSHKGPGGGSMLARKAEAITLRDIYHAVNPPSREQVKSTFSGRLQSIVNSALRAFEDELVNTTLAQLRKAPRKSPA